MKMTVQEKVAELEQRIVALEAKLRRTTTVHATSLEPEWSALWRQFDQLMRKAFRGKGVAGG